MDAPDILLVDDDEDIRTTVADILCEEGYTVSQAENGRDALEQLGRMQGKPCLVLLDMMMPEMTGEQLLAALAEQQRLAALPIVVLSAHVASSVEGARKVVRKPLSPEALLAVVREFCTP